LAQKPIDLCTPADVAADLGVAADATVQRVVSAASALLARACGRTFEKATAISEPVIGTGRPSLFVSRPPILAITSITEFGSVVDSADYEIESAAQGMVRKKDGATWGETADYGGNITPTLDRFRAAAGDEGITVVYDGGFVTPGQNALNAGTYPTVTLPEDLQEAAIIVACALYKRRGLDQNLASESLGDWSVSYRGQLPSFIPPEVESLIAPYVLRRA
jgi:hypothetical protein